MNDAFQLGMVEGMDKEAGVRTGLLGLGSGVARRLGRGTGRFGSLMDRISTSLTKRRKNIQGITKLKSDFKSRAPGMAPAAREKARGTMQRKIQAQKQSMRPPTAPEPKAPKGGGPAPAPAPQAPAGGEKPKKSWYTSKPAIGAAGLALGAAGTMGIAAGMRSAQPTTVTPARY